MPKLFVKKVVCAAVIAGSCATANATEYDLHTLSIGANAFLGYVAPGFSAFADTFDFILPANGGSDYTIEVADLPASLGFNMMFQAMSLYSVGVNGQRGGNDDVLLGSGLAGSGNNTESKINVSLPGSPMSQGMYLVVSGVADGTAGGIYSGSIAVFPVTTPVPEPEAWAMMLIGAGLVGFRLRTRSKKAAASRLV